MFGEVFDTTQELHVALHDHRQDAGGARLPVPGRRPASFASRGQADRRSCATFFADDDWYTDADSNVYQLPTFLGNHDMGRIGRFVQADNPGAGDAEWLARDRLAHELMYFSRGNPVIYYGDEQGFTGGGGDQDARQTMFASQVPRLPRRRPARHRRHPRRRPTSSRRTRCTGRSRRWPRLTQRPPGAARRRAAAPLRRRRAPASTRSRASTASEQREYVVALNNSEQAADRRRSRRTRGKRSFHAGVRRRRRPG